MSNAREDRQKTCSFLRSLDQVIDMGHSLVRLAAQIDDRFGSVCQADSGQPGCRHAFSLACSS